MAHEPKGVLTGGGDGATAPSATHTLTLPAGAAVGDKVIVASTLLSSTATATIASGGTGAWTTVSGPDDGATGTGTRAYLWAKTLTAGDLTGSIVVTWTASSRGIAVGLVYPDGVIGGVGRLGIATAFGGASSITATGVNVEAGDSLLRIGFIKANSGVALPTVTLPSGYTRDKDAATAASAATNYRGVVSHLAVTAAGTAGADTSTFSSAANGAMAYTVAVSPPAPPNVPPTVDVIGRQEVAAGALVNLSATGADSDGSIAGYAWSFDYPSSGAPTLTGANTATPSFTAGAAGSLYILRCTVTDNSGATASATTEVRVPLVSSSWTARPLPTTGSGTSGWSIVGGSGTVGGALADESDATYIESAALTSTAQTRRVRVQPVATSTGVSFSARLSLSDAVAATVKMRLYEGSVLRQEWPVTVTNTPTTYDFALTTPSAIGDWGSLFLELVGSA